VKRLKLSVTDFAQKYPLTGDIDETSLLAQVAPELGMEIHREIQEQRSRDMVAYHPEWSVKETLIVDDDLEIHLSGRIDGMWQDSSGTTIEEIKTTFNLRALRQRLLNDPNDPYNLQIKTYGWILWRRSGNVPNLQFLLVAAGSRDQELLKVDFDPDEFAAWIEQRKISVSDLSREVDSFRDSRISFAKTIRFPYSKKRALQAELMHDVSEAYKQKSQLIAQAPTGLGKTAAVIFPLLKSVLRRGDKVFYVTPKNSQLREAETFVRSLQRKKIGLLGLIMTSKAKLCVNSEVNCRPDRCKFANGHYDKVNQHQLIEQLRNEGVVNGDLLRDYALRFEVCPYELSRQLLPWVDVFAGDYHYALSPRANLRELAKLPLSSEQRPVLAIDEAHNLAERALDWYSHSVTLIPDEVISRCSEKIQDVLIKINSWIEQSMVRAPIGAVLRSFKPDAVIDLVDEWSRLMPIVLEKANDNDDLKALVDHWFSWLNFVELCRHQANTITEPASQQDLGDRKGHGQKVPNGLSIDSLQQIIKEPLITAKSYSKSDVNLFFATKGTNDTTLALHCVNAGPLMRDAIGKYHAVVAFSATMKPFTYHEVMIGFDRERLLTREYGSPFPAQNRKIIAIPQISTAFNDRPKSIPRIGEVINRVVALRRGNYVAFFPSFDLMSKVRPLISADGFQVIDQPPKASGQWVRDTIKVLRQNRNVLLMAVQGGVLSEGVDLPGEDLIGAFIVGPALSMLTPEREERRRILGDSGADGFALTYGFPAMAKSIQSAGRVIRSPEDRGIIILMDPRFLKDPYVGALPLDWLPDGAVSSSLLSYSILSDISQFWSKS
jgi:DNA excision repair protein ERCC-2